MRALTRSARRLTHCLAVLALFAGVGACRSAPEQPTPGPERIRVLLDTDANNELDDQHAIAYLLFNGGVFDVEGIVKNPAWATARRIPAPKLESGGWVDRPDHPRTIVVWENFEGAAIMRDFYASMERYELAR